VTSAPQTAKPRHPPLWRPCPLPAPRLRQAAGAALLAFALRSPEKARWCFARLLDTDGLRGDVHPDTGEWTWGYLRLEVRRVLSTLHNATLNSEPSTLN